MGFFDDARELIEHAKSEMPKIEKAYEESLHSNEIKPALLIEIKNLMENLRSALDFTAHGLFTKYGFSSKTDPHIYFPYASQGQSLQDFQKWIDICIPGLSASRTDIVAELERMQYFSSCFARHELRENRVEINWYF